MLLYYIIKIKFFVLCVVYLQYEYIFGYDIEYLLVELRIYLNVNEDIFIGKIGLFILVVNVKVNQFDKYFSIFMIFEDENEEILFEIIFFLREYL